MSDKFRIGVGTNPGVDPNQPETAENVEVLERYVHQMLTALKPGGLWIAPDTAPLTAATVERVFRDAAESAPYERHHLALRTQDGFWVELIDGVVSKNPL